MTGEVKSIGPDLYVETNEYGTLEKLPRLGWFRQLYVAVSTAIRPWHLDYVRSYCRRHGKRK